MGEEAWTMTMKKKNKKIIANTAKYIALGFLSIIVIIPIYYLVVTTFKTSTEAAVAPMALPSHIDFSGYVNAFQKMQYPRAFKNTLIITGCSVVGLIIVSSMCGYVLNRKGKHKVAQSVFLLILSGMMFPYQMSILGLYKVIQQMHLMNSLLGVILINIAINIPFATFLIKSFVNTIPIELEEAAKIDGCGTFRTFWTITFPLMKPTIATVAILNTLTIWNDFMGPLYFLQ